MTKRSKSKKTTSKKLSNKARDLNPRSTAIAQRMREILGLLGEDNRREGLLETPERYAQAMDFLTRGYSLNIEDIVGNALFESPSSEMVIVRDIELFSMCEHHLLPFYGKAHVAYIPRKKIIGLSKIPRIVDVYSRRLQVQERLTDQVAKEIQRILKPAGVAVVVEAFHLCMMMRGVEKQYSYTITSSMQGVFRKDEKTRKEFLGLINTPRTVR